MIYKFCTMKKTRCKPIAPEKRASRWKPLATFLLSIGLLFVTLLLFSAQKNIKELQDKLRETSDAVRREPAKPALAQPVEYQTACDFFRAKAKELSGTHEVLAMVDRGDFNILRANCLIAKDIPECADLNPEKVDAWFSAVADKIRTITKKYLESDKGKEEVAKWGEARVRVEGIASFLTLVQKIEYVENDVFRADWPWHSFVFGIVKEGRGTCMTMAVAWKIIGDKLGYPLSLRHTYKHVYLHWNDGHADFNIKPTNQGKVYPDDEYRAVEKVTLEEQAGRVFMADLTPRQILASFISQRAAYWVATEECVKGLEDSLLALELDPNHPRFKHNVMYGFYDAQDQLEAQAALLAGPQAAKTIQTFHAKKEEAHWIAKLRMEHRLDQHGNPAEMAPQRYQDFMAQMQQANPAMRANPWMQDIPNTGFAPFNAALPKAFAPGFNPPRNFGSSTNTFGVPGPFNNATIGTMPGFDINPRMPSPPMSNPSVRQMQLEANPGNERFQR